MPYFQSSAFAGLQPREKWHIGSPREGSETATNLSWKDKPPQRAMSATSTVVIIFLVFIEIEPAIACKLKGSDLQFIQQQLTLLYSIASGFTPILIAMS